jgi:single-strand DNA-binding protein
MLADNLVFLRGHLGATPEVKTLPSGARVIDLRLATNSRWKNAEGGMVERTDWHRISAFGYLVDRCQHLNKGDNVTVCGTIRNDVVPQPDGAKRVYPSIKAFDVARISLTGGAPGASRVGPPVAVAQTPAPLPAVISDEIPF